MNSTTPEKASARDRLLAAAAELFYEEGINTVGIDRVIDHAGVAKASLYNVFGSKDVSRKVAAAASAKTGVDTDILKKMLPIVAAMAMGGLGRQAAASGAGTDSRAAKGGLMAMLEPMLYRLRSI